MGVFTVKKKDDSLRLILDCRPASRMFLAPPGVSLLSGEGLGRIEYSDGPEDVDFDGVPLSSEDPGYAEPLPELALGTTDVQNCFHRVLFDKEGDASVLSEYFGFPSVRAAERS